MATVRDLSGNNSYVDEHISGKEDEDYGSVTTLTPGTPINGGRALDINCSVAGDVQVKYANDSTFVYAIGLGTSRIVGSIKDVVAGGTTATATYAIVK